MPITASPAPCSSPSRIDTAIPFGSSAGWFGCNRVDSVPRAPSVLRNAVTTSHLRATRIRSWLRISFETAATISGVKPGAAARRGPAVAAGDSSQSRSSPTVIERNGAKAAASCVSRISRVTSSTS